MKTGELDQLIRLVPRLTASRPGLSPYSTPHKMPQLVRAYSQDCAATNWRRYFQGPNHDCAATIVPPSTRKILSISIQYT